MIIVKLMGGLGNQMFQYAVARRLAMQHGTEVTFDGSFFDQPPAGDTPRDYELNHMGVKARFATPMEIAEMSGDYRNAWQRFLVNLRRMTGVARYAKNPFCERSSSFDSTVRQLPDNTYLVGYWQAEEYFADIRDQLCEEFSILDPLTGQNQELAARVASCESVAVHFRRGDYVTSEKTASYHGTLSQDYYRKAIETIREHVERPELFIFSDDPVWVRENVTFELPVVFVDHNGPEQSYEDLRLMSLCRHAVIANSSFSWWGGWLNASPEKVVVAPKRWLAGSEDSGDRLPQDWIKV